tara:strand:+ start:1208 stop:2359 length:1152 start_codon:yes stop_codon:yes gene_type:complete
MVNIFSALNNTYPDAMLRNPMIRNQSPISVLPTPRPSSIGAINQDFPPVPMMRPDDLLSQTNQVQEPPLNTQGSLGSGFGGLFGQNMSDPQTQGILAASSALLKQGAPSFQPKSFGGILGETINQGLGAFNRAERRGRNNLQVVGGSLIDVSDPSNPKVVFEGRKKPKTQILGGGKYIATQDPDTGEFDIKKSSIFDEISKLEDKTGGIGTLTEGQKAIDKSFSKDYSDFVLKGGFADVQKGLNQLDEAVNILETDGGTGEIIGNLNPMAAALFNKSGLKAQELVSEVVQRNLRLILGAQFTEKEGERLINRAFNPRLSEEENIKRVKRLADSIKRAADQKRKSAEYFEKFGTLKGFKGTASINSISEGAGLNSKNVNYKVVK